MMPGPEGHSSTQPLGHFLLQTDAVSRAQLEEALQNQSILGGKLGTNLVELGHLTLDELEAQLSKFLGVAAVNPHDFDAINPHLISSVPRRLIDQYHFLPLKKENQILQIATHDPRNQAMLQEIVSVLGIKIHAFVASEIRLLFYLNHYLKHPVDIRYRNIFFHYRKTRALGKNVPYEVMDTGKRDLLRKGFKPLEKGEELTQDGFEAYLLQQNMDAIANQNSVPGASPPQPSVSAVKASTAVEPEAPVLTLEDLKLALDSLKDREQIAHLVLDYAGQFAQAGVIFTVHNALVSGWEARGKKLSRDNVRGLVFPLIGESVFQTLEKSRNSFFGKLSPSPINEQLLLALGLSIDQAVLIAPVFLKKRLVNIFLAANQGPRPLRQPDQAAILGLLRWLPQAYEHLILAKKKNLPES